MTEARDFWDVFQNLAKRLLWKNEVKDYQLMAVLNFSPQAWSRWRPKLIEAITDRPETEIYEDIELARVFYSAVDGKGERANIRVNYTALHVQTEKISLLKEFADLFKPTVINPNTNFVFDIHFDNPKNVKVVRALSIDFDKKTKTWFAKPKKPVWGLNGEWVEIPEKFLPLIMKAK